MGNKIEPSYSEHWTVKEAAEYLGCSTSFMYHLIKTGEIPCVYIDGLIGKRVYASELDKYIEPRTNTYRIAHGLKP